MKELLISENHIVAIFSSGVVMCWNESDNFSLVFETGALKNKRIEKAAFFSRKLGRWFLAILSQKEVYLWTTPSNTEPNIFVFDCENLDKMFFLKKGQDLVGIEFEKGIVYLFSMASFTMRTIRHTASIYSSCHFANEFGYCSSGNEIFQIMSGHHHNTTLGKIWTNPGSFSTLLLIFSIEILFFF